MGQEGPDKKGKRALGSNNDYFSKLASLELFLIQVCVYSRTSRIQLVTYQ